jgi:hypothetical protein
VRIDVIMTGHQLLIFFSWSRNGDQCHCMAIVCLQFAEELIVSRQLQIPITNHLVSCVLQVLQAFHRNVSVSLLDSDVTWINMDVQANLIQETNNSFCCVFRVVTIDGFWIGELDLLIQLGTTSNYSAIAYLHTLQITTR